MEISARYQLDARVKQIRIDGLMAEVILDVGGQEMVSTITRGAAERLKLAGGDKVKAIIKATEVLIGK